MNRIPARFVLLCVGMAMDAAAEDRKLDLIDNSSGISQVFDLNARGEILGTKEVQTPLGLGQEPFFRSGPRELKIGLLEGFTHLEPKALSDTGLVVGYASRTIGHPDGSLRAFLWEATSQQTVNLGTLPGDRGSIAFDISSDGSIVTGYSTGRDPARMLPCFWERIDSRWKCSALSTIQAYNPFLLSSRVVISDDGTRIAACLAVRSIPGIIPRYENSLFMWTRNTQGSWQRSRLLDTSLTLADISNQGILAGSCVINSVRRAFVYDPQEGFQILELLEGDVSSQALALNNHGIVVGFSDDPFGPTGGPQAFIWSKGTLSPLDFTTKAAYSSASAINDKGQVAGYLVTEEEDAELSKAFVFVLSQ